MLAVAGTAAIPRTTTHGFTEAPHNVSTTDVCRRFTASREVVRAASVIAPLG